METEIKKKYKDFEETVTILKNQHPDFEAEMKKAQDEMDADPEWQETLRRSKKRQNLKSNIWILILAFVVLLFLAALSKVNTKVKPKVWRQSKKFNAIFEEQFLFSA